MVSLRVCLTTFHPWEKRLPTRSNQKERKSDGFPIFIHVVRGEFEINFGKSLRQPPRSAFDRSKVKLEETASPVEILKSGIQK